MRPFPKTNRWLVVPIGLACIIGCLSFFDVAASSETLTEEGIKQIYTNLVRATGDGRTPPELKFIKKQQLAGPAMFRPASFAPASSNQPSRDVIFLREDIGEFTGSFGGDAEPALAFILGHELAHFQRRHAWTHDLVRGFIADHMGETSKILKEGTSPESVRAETEADYTAGFYGHLAGYPVLQVAPRVLDRVYATYVKNPLPGYPPLEERKAITLGVAKKLNEMLVVFDAAYHSLLIGAPLAAARLFDVVSDEFPSREVLGNAGLARAMHAITLFDEEEVPFIYPWEVDTEMRFDGVRSSNANPPNARRVEREQWLREADAKLLKASSVDTTYIPAHINRALVMNLLGKTGSAVDEASEAMTMAVEQNNSRARALAVSARGIANASAGKCDAAKEDFTAAQKLGYDTATTNLAVLPCSSNGQTNLPSIKQGVKTTQVEQILQLTPVQAKTKFPAPLNRKDFPAIQVPMAKALPGVTLSWSEGAGAQLVIVKTTDDPLSYVMLRTLPGYTGKTSQGISLGSPTEDIQEKYGHPTRRMEGQEGQFLTYEAERIVFQVKDGHVLSWMLY